MSDHPEQPEHDKQEHIRTHLKLSDHIEIEVEGSPEVVNKHIEHILPLFAELLSSTPPTPTENDGNLYDAQDSSGLAEREVQRHRVDLVDFYAGKSPQTQVEQVLVITYFYQRYKGRKVLTLDDYREAYASLKRIKVPEPSNYKSSVRNVVDRTMHLYNPERGGFALTPLRRKIRRGANGQEGLTKEQVNMEVDSKRGSLHISEVTMPEGYVYERCHTSDLEVEILAPRDYVAQRMTELLSILSNTKVIDSPTANQAPKENTPLIGANNGGVPEALISGNFGSQSNEKPADLLLFYQKAGPQNQWQQILALTYWYQVHQGRENVSVKDFKDAYHNLRRVGVKKPANIAARAQDAIDRVYLCKLEEDQYELTLQGKEFVQNLINDVQDASEGIDS